MTQLWTITAADGTVLCPTFETPSAGSHPKDNGWAWDAATQRATRIDAIPDPQLQQFNGAEWVGDLSALRARKWDEVKAQTGIAESWGCTIASGRVQTDADSRGKITGLVVMAIIAQAAGQPFSQVFTLLVGEVTVDAPGMIAIGLAAGTHVATCHAIAQAKRAAIDAATDEAAIAAVDVEGGWPDAPPR